MWRRRRCLRLSAVIAILALMALGILPMTDVRPAMAASSEDVTITVTGIVVDAPGGFIVFYVSDYEVGLAWTKPTGANMTMIRAKYGSYPTSRIDGYQVYYGSGESCSDTAVSLDETAIEIYYIGFSETASGQWSPLYAQGFLEPPAVKIIAFIILALGVTAIAFWSKRRPLCFLSMASWLGFGFYAFNQTYTGNEYLDDLFLWIGLVGALICMFEIVLVTRGMRPEPPAVLSSEQQVFEDVKKGRQELREARALRPRRRFRL